MNKYIDSRERPGLFWVLISPVLIISGLLSILSIPVMLFSILASITYSCPESALICINPIVFFLPALFVFLVTVLGLRAARDLINRMNDSRKIIVLHYIIYGIIFSLDQIIPIAPFIALFFILKLYGSEFNDYCESFPLKPMVVKSNFTESTFFLERIADQ